jgi:hypothetical protein
MNQESRIAQLEAQIVALSRRVSELEMRTLPLGPDKAALFRPTYGFTLFNGLIKGKNKDEQ